MDIELREFKRFSEEMETFYGVLYVLRQIFLITGMISNLFVCFVMMKKKVQRKTLSKFFIFHLASADIVFRILGIYEIVAQKLSGDGSISQSHCKVIVFFQYTCEAVLFALLAGIAVDRSKNIIHPLNSFKHKYCHRKKTIVLIWIYALSISAGFCYSATNKRFKRYFKRTQNISTDDIMNGSNVLTFKSPRAHCIAGLHETSESQIAFTIYFVCGFLVPLCIMIICYTNVFHFLSNRAKRSILNRSVLRSKFRTLFILVLLVFSFLFSWGPITLLDLIESFVHLSKNVGQWFRPIAETLCYSSSILNPVIYSFGNKSFRKEAISLLLCNRRYKCSFAN